MACVGVALGLKAVFGSTDHPLVAKAVAELFILTAVVIFGSACWRSYQAQRRIDAHDANCQSHYGMIITAGVILWLL